MSRNRKKNHYSPKSFEAIGQKFKGIHGAMMADTSATIFESMLQSDAFKSLNPKQQILYVYCKAQYYGKRKPEKDYPDIPQFEGADLFYFNWDIAQEYGLYKPSCNKNFRNDMQALIQHGFIEIVASGKAQHKKNVYKFSSKWKTWDSS